MSTLTATLSFEGQGALLKGTVTVDPASTGSATVVETSITVTGAATGDCVIMNPPAAIEAGVVWAAFVSASNTVKLRIANLSGGTLDCASGTWNFTLIRT
jgi:hypothetical protein